MPGGADFCNVAVLERGSTGLWSAYLSQTRPRLAAVAVAAWLVNALAPFGSWWQMLSAIVALPSFMVAPPLRTLARRMWAGAGLLVVTILQTPSASLPVPELQWAQDWWGHTGVFEWERAWMGHWLVMWLPLVVIAVEALSLLAARWQISRGRA